MIWIAAWLITLYVAWRFIYNKMERSFQQDRATYLADQRKLEAELGQQFAEKVREMESRSSALIENRIQTWVQNESATIHRNAEERAAVQLSIWREDETDSIRKDAIAKSISVVRGKVTEHLVPYLGPFPYDPRDCRFLGAPIDLLVFDGLYGDGLKDIVFLEVKTGKASLSPREKSVREAINAGRVRWEQVRVDDDSPCFTK